MSLFCAAKGQMWHMGRIKVVQSLIASQGVHFYVRDVKTVYSVFSE